VTPTTPSDLTVMALSVLNAHSNENAGIARFTMRPISDIQ